MSDLDTVKKRLSDTLRDRMNKYWELMKDWYRRRISKEEFDSDAKHLLGENNIYLHNEFLFAILVKCQTALPPSPPASSSESPMHPPPTPSPVVVPSPVSLSPPEAVPPPPETPPPTTPLQDSEAIFAVTSHKPPPAKKPKLLPVPEIPYGALDPMKYHQPEPINLLPRDLDCILLCTHEMVLPDMSTLHMRMLLVAWELELDGVSEKAADLLMLALKQYLKNVIQALICSQTSWQGCRFQHSFGHGPSSRPLLYPGQPLSAADAGVQQNVQREGAQEAEAIRVASLNFPVREKEPLNLFHLRDALKVNKHCVPVHSVYSFNMERILAGMWHPSEEEETQKKVVEGWKKSLEKDTPFSLKTAVKYNCNGHR